MDLARFGVKTICEKIYRVLENYLKGNNRKNELYIARHMKTFSSHMNKQVSKLCMHNVSVRLFCVTGIGETVLCYRYQSVRLFCVTGISE